MSREFRGVPLTLKPRSVSILKLIGNSILNIHHFTANSISKEQRTYRMFQKQVGVFFLIFSCHACWRRLLSSSFHAEG